MSSQSFKRRERKNERERGNRPQALNRAPDSEATFINHVLNLILNGLVTTHQCAFKVFTFILNELFSSVTMGSKFILVLNAVVGATFLAQEQQILEQMI